MKVKEDSMLSEIINVLDIGEKSPEEVMWVGTTGFYTSWGEFSRIANDILYFGSGYMLVDDRFSGINEQFLIAGNDWIVHVEDNGNGQIFEFKRNREVKTPKEYKEKIHELDIMRPHLERSTE